MAQGAVQSSGAPPAAPAAGLKRDPAAAPRQVDGREHGVIRHAGSLSIGPQGAVHGDLLAAEIIVRGEVRGDLFASERIRLEAGARVFGDLYAPRVGLEPGAQLRGRLHMRSAETARTLDESAVEGLLADAAGRKSL